jgi:hypothetical protein
MQYTIATNLKYGVEDFKLLQFVEEVLIPLFQQVKKVQDEMNLIIAESKTKPYVKLDYKL